MGGPIRVQLRVRVAVGSLPTRNYYIAIMSWIDQHPRYGRRLRGGAPRADASVEPPVFREAMSRLGAAVHVITTDGPGGKTGFTATAVCSVSDAPPTLLVCLNRRSNQHADPAQNGVFCVNTLRAGDEIIADIFAGRTKVAREARFDTGQWATLSTGSPVLSAPWSPSTAACRGQGGRLATTSISAWSRRSTRAARAGAGLSRPRLQAGVSRRKGSPHCRGLPCSADILTIFPYFPISFKSLTTFAHLKMELTRSSRRGRRRRRRRVTVRSRRRLPSPRRSPCSFLLLRFAPRNDGGVNHLFNKNPSTVSA